MMTPRSAPQSDELDAAVVLGVREQARAARRPFMDVLEESLEIDGPALVRQLAMEFGYAPITWRDLSQWSAAFDQLPYAESVRRECAALRTPAGRLAVVLADPYDGELLEWLEAQVCEPFQYCLAHRSEILAFLSKQEESMRAMDHASLEASAPESPPHMGREELSLQSIAESESPIVKLVSSTLYDALKSRASDIHFEATADGLTIKYRIDGVLGVLRTVPGRDVAEQVVSRVKVMAELDISERRIPQDGRFKATRGGREIDFRVSVMPSIHGEDVVVRILDKRYIADQMESLRLEHLGFSQSVMRKLRALAGEPHGMLLVTGPTGSGKTTTLYAVISEVNSGIDKIVTIEDPVEYQLPGVLQIPVNERKGLTFARGLRSILRHDPDRIMIGEIRDAETAEIAVQSALTGHLVYTTVHANNVVDVIGRLLHMKIDPYSLGAAVNGVLAQRLLRTNCTSCAVEYQPPAELLTDSHIAQSECADYRFLKGEGCGECRGSGYLGRSAIGELLVLNDELRELIATRSPIRLLKERALASGTRFLRDAALALVRTGATTIEEANRVTSVG